MSSEDALNYRRGRSGRPIARIRKYIRTHGLHICYLCGEYIEVDLPDTHRMSWTIDHVLPLKLYPHLALEIDNMREAHRSCNSRKRDGDGSSGTATHHGSQDW